MSDPSYLVSVLLLSLIGIVLSYVNTHIVVCPRNTKTNYVLDLGFILLFLASSFILAFDLNFALMKYFMLAFVFSAVVYVANKSLNHFFYHAVRKNHFCKLVAYRKKVKEMLGE